MPLKGIPFILSPDLLQVLCAAGHGDEIGNVHAFLHLPTTTWRLTSSDTSASGSHAHAMARARVDVILTFDFV